MMNTPFRHFLVFASLAFVAGIVISGCCSSTTFTPPPPTNFTPKSGSTDTYHKHEIDSSAAQGKTTGDSTIVAVVVSSGTSFRGKSNVVTVYDDYDTLRYSIESNGDVSVFKPNF